MGYCYDAKGKLVCDSCGKGGARKRTCPEIVDGLPFCLPPALCSACYKREGGNKAIHASCHPRAQRSRDRAERRHKRLNLGEYLHVASWGAGMAYGAMRAVPEGWVGVRFVSSHGDERFRLAVKADFDATRARAAERDDDVFQFDFEALAPWHAEWPDRRYEARVQALEEEGCTRSDAQAVVDAQDAQ